MNFDSEELEVFVFPLPSVTLFPATAQPLNIFEPRYVSMIDDVMSGERIIGILQPMLAGDDDQESPIDKSAGLRSVGCAGRVTSYQELDDGRLIITLTGIARFESISEAETDEPYSD